MIEIEFNNTSTYKVQEELLKEAVTETLHIFPEKLSNKKLVFSLAAVPAEEIKKLNAIYRKKDKVTDVLSFSQYKNLEELRNEPQEEVLVGELIFCCEYIENSAKMNNVPFDKELVYVISHGVLHLLGVRHGKPMFKIQDEVTNKICPN